jgi:hypothetical protein
MNRVYPKPMLVLMVGLLVCMPLSVLAVASHNSRLVGLAYLAAPLWMMGFFTWVILFGTSKRWPHLALGRRVELLCSFDGPGQHQADKQADVWRANNQP